MKLTLDSALAVFGARAKEKLANPAASGQPEDQLRSPFEHLLGDLAELSNIPRAVVAAVGESAVSELKTRPDYAITVRNALVGFVEIKAPGKGADPRKFKDAHDKEQWDKLRSLPNLLYTDGNAFSLWQNGELVGSVITLIRGLKGTDDISWFLTGDSSYGAASPGSGIGHVLATTRIPNPPYTFALHLTPPQNNHPLTSSQGVRALFHRRAESARK